MVEIKWTDQALFDIENIAEYIAKDSPFYASVQVQRFFDATDILHSQPEAGRVVPEIKNQDIREIILGNYRIIYRIISSSRIVHHSSRLIKDLRLL